MAKNTFSFKELKSRTVQNKFNIIVGVIILILLFGLVNFYSSMKIMSGIRSYVGGEGLWSKAQKEAVNNLVKYTTTGDESDYNKYLSFVRVPMGDKQARLEMDKAHPNFELVKQGFIQGGNNPSDVKDLIFLYRRFRKVSYMSSAIQIWSQGDQEMENLLSVGNKIHSLVSSSSSSGTISDQAAKKSELNTRLSQIYISDGKLTELENQFSETLGNGSRGIAHVLLLITIITTTFLGLLAIIIAVLVARAVIRLDKLKSEFASLASHQLRTPLTAINWYAESLLSEAEGKLNEQQKNHLSELYGGGQRMVSLINDLLEVSSLELGTYKSESKLVDINGNLETTLKDQRLSIGKKGITLTKTVDPYLPKLNVDEQLLTVVFQNLLSNSIKYTPEFGQINVKVSRKKKNLLVTVSDNGVGIPKNQQSQIFTKLFRADNVQKLDANGTGLGLYIIKAMLQSAGGKIWFDSVENQGTNFYVKLPIYGRHRSKTSRPKNG